MHTRTATPPAPPADNPMADTPDPDADEPGAIAVRPRTVALDALVMRDPHRAIEIVQARIDALGAIRRAALAATGGNDWTVSKDKEGRAVATLRASGAQRIRKFYGISVHPSGPVEIVRERGSDNVERIFAEARGDAICGLTGETADELVGRRGLREQFIGRTEEIAGLGDLRQAARTSLETKAVRVLAGMSAIDPAELGGAWGCTPQVAIDKCYRGHGFGSSDERRSGGAGNAGAGGSTGGSGKISEKQGKLLWARGVARAQELGIGREDLMAAVLRGLHVERTEEIPASSMDAAIKAIADYRPAAAREPGAEE